MYTHFVLYKNPSQNNPKSKYSIGFLKKKTPKQTKKGKSKLYLPKNGFLLVWVPRKRQKKAPLGFTGVGQ
jgi:hypothetical protein